jgi:HD-like signal output (HDOD) protein
MTAKLLQMANSAFFTRRAPTADLRTAIMRLGMNTIRHLVLAVELFDTRGLVGRTNLTDFGRLRDNALQMATIAEQLGKDTDLRGEAFTMGLLADIGQFVFALTRKEAWEQCRQIAKDTGRELHDVEYEHLGVSHAEVGGFLLGIWGLPFSVVEAVVHHHHPERIAARVMGSAAITALANAVVYGSELDSKWVSEIGAEETLIRLRAEHRRKL